MGGAKPRLAVGAKFFSKKGRKGAFNWRTRMAHEPPNARATTHENSGFLERTFAEHQAPLTRYATRLLGGDADRARDVVQDTFVRLMGQPPEVVNGHTFEWLFTVCRHRALDVLRKANSRVTNARPWRPRCDKIPRCG
jgi:RNA polymerase sigma-70 factor (ECF subfamily)